MNSSSRLLLPHKIPRCFFFEKIPLQKFGLRHLDFDYQIQDAGSRCRSPNYFLILEVIRIVKKKHLGILLFVAGSLKSGT
jgi:hypothetical protein